MQLSLAEQVSCYCCSHRHAELQHCIPCQLLLLLLEILLVGGGIDNTNLIQNEGRLQTGVATWLSCFLLSMFALSLSLLVKTPCCK